ncbi:zinc-binding dehydrogenase [Kineosporia babensis]|uniref:Zinc-binding dehydrogenase n=1 Tax=Kineosporia babensis TaxID=499548 RepID=A0A9X1SUP9_9ACTN|nr:zinc-binding dehydrogenase [Kineosporia babensis]MCD5311950.1 zinc-binding dehydrogenase [Kineosporia babensis]
MRAVVAESTGGPDVLKPVDLPDPRPGEGQVLVQVEVAAITFMDVMRRSGSPIAPPAQFPLVLGNGVAGLVNLATGRKRVVTSTGGSGGYASMALANRTDLHEIPDNVDSQTAAALLADGRTALGLFEAAQIQPAEVVVVTAAAGGVGSLLVQLAQEAGAQVIGLVGSPAKLRHVQAESKMTYSEGGWKADVVFDGIGADLAPQLFDRVNDHGRYLQHGAAGGRFGQIDADQARRRRIEVIGLDQLGDSFDLTERALARAAEGRLQPLIGQIYPLDEAARAHAAIEQRTAVGKSLLLP